MQAEEEGDQVVEGRGQKQEGRVGGYCNNPGETIAAWTRVVMGEVVGRSQALGGFRGFAVGHERTGGTAETARFSA